MFSRASYVVLDLPEPTASRVREVRERYSPLRAQYPSEITVAGSGGVGPIARDEVEDTVFGALRHIAATTPPVQVALGAVRRFEGTNLFYFSVEDPSPIISLHNKLCQSDIQFQPSRFPFTPHCTISGVPLDDAQVQELSGVRIAGSFILTTLAVYSEPLPLELHFRTQLTG